jgi:enoyl-CoA hydratase/carnithine racemase
VALALEKRSGIAYLTISNAAKANVLDDQTSSELSAAWREVWDDRQVRVAIITGAGDRHFCAGHNLAPRPGMTPEEREFQAVERLFWPNAGTVNGNPIGADPRMGDHYPQIWKPVIAAVNGWAVGAGFYLLLASTDIRVASAERARFKLGMLSNGLVGGGPGATLLARQVRYADAMRILLTDEPFDAAEALRIGLVNEVVPHAELMARAEKIASQIAKMPPVAARMVKEFAIRFRDMPVDVAWQVQTLMNSMVVNMTVDPEEARRAFAEKREPNFSGGLRRRGDPYPAANGAGTSVGDPGRT